MLLAARWPCNFIIQDEKTLTFSKGEKLGFGVRLDY